ncbi:MAG: hypothetical protein CSYNP_03616 [Syntrophus sp. SKADARSKE-3]|nr:hypothetical protein [Syntrophus sp. SKADARSKE-3]
MTDYHYGGFWRRFIAILIDQIILSAVYGQLFFLGAMAGLSGFSLSTYQLSSDAILKATGGLVILYHAFCCFTNMTYFTWFHGAGGRTPGKMAMGLMVIQASGQEMTLGVAFLRWAGYIVSFLFFCLGYIWVAFDPKKQGWHDKIAGTVVIVKKEKYLDKAGDI